jgi:hypothetical protein
VQEPFVVGQIPNYQFPSSSVFSSSFLADGSS